MNDTLDTEKNILGLILVKETLLDTDFLSLDKSYFDNIHNKSIFNTIMKLRMNNVKVDIVSVSEQLKEDKVLEKIGGRAYINDLALNAPETVFAKFQFNILEKNYQLRQIHNIGYNITEKVKQGVNPDELISDSLDKLNNLLIKGENNDDTVKMQEECEELINRYSSEEEKELFYTSYPDLDNIIQGTERGDMVILGADPGVGKSAFRCCLEVSAHYQMIPCHVFNLEMSREKETDRLVSNVCEIDIGKFTTNKFTDTELKVIQYKKDEILSKMDLTVYNNSSADISYIRKKLQAEQKRRGKLGVVIIDHFHRIVEKGDAKERATSLAIKLKQIALDFNCYLIVLCHLRKRAYVDIKTGQTRNPKPTVSDLKDSQAIEGNADTVVLIHREDLDSIKSEFIVPKNRHGGSGECYLNFYGKYMRFSSSNIKHL